MADYQTTLAEVFEVHRSRLRRIAYRMLGSTMDADDAVQEAWLHLSRSDSEAVENIGAWLTTVVSRICLDMLRSRGRNLGEPWSEDSPNHPLQTEGLQDPEDEALLAESVGTALMVVLDRLTPGERVSFVLHDLFGVSFPEIARLLQRSEGATRQLASRARRTVRGAVSEDPIDQVRQWDLVAAFLSASRAGNFRALLMLLDPEVVLRADAQAVQMGAAGLVSGAPEVAQTFLGRARGAAMAVIDGFAGAVWAPQGTPLVVFIFSMAQEKVSAIDVIADRDHVQRLHVRIGTV